MHSQEEKENFCNAVRNEVKAVGLMDTTDTLWEFFIDKVGRQTAARAGAALLSGPAHHVDALPCPDWVLQPTTPPGVVSEESSDNCCCRCGATCMSCCASARSGTSSASARANFPRSSTAWPSTGSTPGLPRCLAISCASCLPSVSARVRRLLGRLLVIQSRRTEAVVHNPRRPW